MNQQNKSYCFGLGAVLCWSTVATAFKLSLTYLSPAQLLLVSSAVSWFFLAAVLFWQGKLDLVLRCSFKGYARSLLLGILNPLLYYLVLFKAYDLLPAQEAQAINYTWALTMALLSVPLLGHRLKASEITAALICYSGVLVIATRGEIWALQFSNGTGVGLAILSTLLWALYWIFNTRDKRDPVLALFLNFSFALPMVLLYCLWQGEVEPLAWQGVAGAAYVGVFEMGLSFVLWLSAMKLTKSAARISNLIFISPFLSLLLIYLLLDEAILASTIIGLFLILCGLGVQQLRATNLQN